MKTKILLIVFFGCISYNFSIGQKSKKIKHENPGQTRKNKNVKMSFFDRTSKLDTLSNKERDLATIDYNEFLSKSLALGFTGTYTGFRISNSSFYNFMRYNDLTKECSTNDTCFGVRIYPAYDKNAELYLVFMGELYYPDESKPSGIGYITLTNGVYFEVKKGVPDLKIIEDYNRSTAISDIKNFIKFYGEESKFYCHSLSFPIGKYIGLLDKLKTQKPIHYPGKFYGIKLFPAYNETSDVNKLYFFAKEEEITITSGTPIRIVKEIKYWFNHMDPCPDECPDNEILPTISPIKKIPKAKKN